MKRTLLSTGILRALAAPLLIGLCSGAVSAQDAEDGAEDETSRLDRIEVTGSRLKRVDIEGPSPITTIDAAQIEREGFTTVYEVLNTLTQSTGTIQTEQDSGTFTQNANVLDLRGIGPGRSLILINGRRATDYPLPYNGQSNIVNLGAIPSAAVERIELLAGGASAIYGSDAVAGVVNIILKREFEGLVGSLRLGGTEDGGGAARRAQLIGGSASDGGKLSFVYAFEYFDRQPVWAFQRDYMDSFADDPTLDGRNVVNTRSVLLLDPLDQDDDGRTYIDPGAAVCARFGPTLGYSFRNPQGFYCGRPDDISQFTLRNADENLSGMLNGSLLLDSGTELFATLNVWTSEGEFNVGTPFWTTLDTPFVLDSGGEDLLGIGGQLLTPQRVYTAQEMGGTDANNQLFDERTWNFAGGVRGAVFDERFEYELSYSHADYTLERDRPLFLKAQIDDYYLGPQLGIDENFGVPIHAVRRDRVLTPLTPEQWRSLSGIDHTDADSSNDVLSLVLTGELWELPAGPVGVAGVLEWGSQQYEIDLDDRLVAGDFWGFTGTGGGGERDRYALGIELGFPLHDTLRLTTAARFDKYDDITEVDDAFTYNLGLEWRPFEALLVRGSYATSFRAPDMHFVFADESGFFGTANDEYLCRRDEPDVPINQCDNAGVSYQGSRSGDPNLVEEEGESYTIGAVWNITDALSLTADYYDIELDNIVGDLSTATILEREADCRLGATEGGEPVDINSARCQDAIARVVRRPVDATQFSEQLVSVATGPINRAILTNTGIDASLKYRLDTEGWGGFAFDLGWTHVLEQKFAEFAEDPVEDFRDDLTNFDARSRVRGSVSWSIADWTTTLFATRYGSIPNWAETGRIGSWTKLNLTVQNQLTENLGVTLAVQNLTDEEPLHDPTFDAYPYYSTSNFDPYGREVFVQFDYRFR
jgi:iron complex outermembrane receptor protein